MTCSVAAGSGCVLYPGEYTGLPCPCTPVPYTASLLPYTACHRAVCAALLLGHPGYGRAVCAEYSQVTQGGGSSTRRVLHVTQERGSSTRRVVARHPGKRVLDAQSCFSLPGKRVLDAQSSPLSSRNVGKTRRVVLFSRNVGKTRRVVSFSPKNVGKTRRVVSPSFRRTLGRRAELSFFHPWYEEQGVLCAEYSSVFPKNREYFAQSRSLFPGRENKVEYLLSFILARVKIWLRRKSGTGRRSLETR